MIKLYKFFLIMSLLILSNCSSVTFSLLGPIFTGARTGSVAQASLSYGTNKLVHDVKKKKRENSSKISMILSD